MKEYLIQSGKYSKYLETKHSLYNSGIDYNDIREYDYLNEEEFKECQRIEYNNHKRKQYNGGYIYEMAFIMSTFKVEYNMYFLTLTFNNDAFNVSEETRHNAVKRYLSANTEMYMANIDFGDLNEREHYHAIVIAKEMPTGWKLGFMKAQKINFDKNNYMEDLKRVKNYILKLNNHSFKVSTKLRRVMKDRNKNFTPKYLLRKVYEEEFNRFKLLMCAI